MQTPPSAFRLTPWVRRLLAANAAVYFLSISLFTGAWFEGLLAFQPFQAASKPWTFVTYMFVHIGFLHLAFNMLMLFFFGPPVERKMGGTAFIRYYFLCGLGGPVLAFGISVLAPVGPFVGASAAVFGIALAFAMYWPNASIFVFPLSFPVPVKYLVAFLVTIDILPLVARGTDGASQLAHLGGLLFGLLYLKGELLVERRVRPVVAQDAAAPVLVAHGDAVNEEGATEAPAVQEPEPENIQEEMDRLLDKISEWGLSSLTAAERRFLDDMSRQMRDS